MDWVNYHQVNMETGKRVTMARNKLGMSTLEFAMAAEVSVIEIELLENGMIQGDTSASAGDTNRIPAIMLRKDEADALLQRIVERWDVSSEWLRNVGDAKGFFLNPEIAARDLLEAAPDEMRLMIPVTLSKKGFVKLLRMLITVLSHTSLNDTTLDYLEAILIRPLYYLLEIYANGKQLRHTAAILETMHKLKPTLTDSATAP